MLMIKPSDAFRIARIDRLRELLQGKHLGSPTDLSGRPEPDAGSRSGRVGPDKCRQLETGATLSGIDGLHQHESDGTARSAAGRD